MTSDETPRRATEDTDDTTAPAQTGRDHPDLEPYADEPGEPEPTDDQPTDETGSGQANRGRTTDTHEADNLGRPSRTRRLAAAGARKAASAIAGKAGLGSLTKSVSDGSVAGDAADVALAAAKGSKFGGAVGAVVSAGAAALRNKRTRKWLIIGLALSLVGSLLPLILLLSLLSGLLGEQSAATSSVNASTASGWSQEETSAMVEATEGTITPWQLLAAVRWVVAGASPDSDPANPYGLDLETANQRATQIGMLPLTEEELGSPAAARLLAVVTGADLARAQKLPSDTTLLAGSALGIRRDGSRGLYVNQDDNNAMQLYESMHQAFLTAIGTMPVTLAADRDEAIFTAAHSLAMGQALIAGCGVGSGIMAADGTWVQPTIDADGKVGSPFGMRLHPVLQQWRLHAGDDLGNAAGTPIFAASNGTVTYVGYNDGAGWFLKVDHGGGIATQYLHMYTRDDILVSTGDVVKAGQHIARMGSAGLSTSPHLHFEVIDHGTKVAPSKFYRAMGLDLAARPTVTGTDPDLWATPGGGSGAVATGTLADAANIKIVGATTFRNAEGGTITFNETMVKNAAIIAQTIARLQPEDDTLTESDRERLFKMAVMTGIQESWMGTAKNMNDGIDVGIFQQRSKVGWYADETTQAANKQRLQDVAYQTSNLVTGHDVAVTAAGGNPVGYHIPGLMDQESWRTDPLWEVIADTQRPAEQYRQQYDKWRPVAESLLASFKGLLTAASQGCGVGDLTVTQANILADLTEADFLSDLRTALDTGADVVTLNEVGAFRGSAKMREYAEAGGYHLLVGQKQANTIFVRKSLGSVIGSGEILVAEKMDGNDERALLWITVDGGGTPLTVISTHALPGIESKGLPDGPEHRLEASYKLFRMLADLAEEKSYQGNVIVTGDMNVDYRRDKRERFAKFPFMTLENGGEGDGLKSSFTEAGVLDEHTISHNRDIDYIYAWETSTNLIRNTGHRIESAVNSDHNFLVATYTTGMSDAGSDFLGTGGQAAGSTANLKPYTKAGFLEIRDRFPAVKNIGGWRASSAIATSDHPKGMAIDVMIPDYRSADGKALGDAVAEYAVANAGRLHIKYVIWRQRSYNVQGSKTWKPMEDRGSDNDNHYNHVHISFTG